tara:strand:+ start:77 stop:769 length:693 start_codon:yes stop_codon:yes gene_type:complete
MVTISRRDLEALAVGFGIADFLSEGRLTKPISKATKTALKKAAPAIARGIIRYGPAVASAGARVTPTGLAVSTAGLLAIQNRDKIADLAAQGYEVLAPAGPALREYGAGVAERALDPETYAPMGEPRDILPLGGPIKRPTKKRLSKFNKAIKKGMSIVKGSTSYGKKGTISNAKKAFSAVTKAASRVNRGRKAPAKGIARKLHTAMTKIIGKKKQTKKTGKTKYKITVNR